MRNDGKRLESLVTFVEETLSPHGLQVETNEHVLNDDGVQIAEFDVHIRGRFGSTKIDWLIECRDRPRDGPAPGSWIEQLVGRRARFGFNKVTAVSTTGFSRGAADFARDQGIELREVSSLDPKSFESWFRIGEMSHLRQLAQLEMARIGLGDAASEELRSAASNLLCDISGDFPILRNTKTGESASLSSAFLGVVQEGKLFEGIARDGPGRRVKVTAQYVSDVDHFVIDTECGPARVHEIDFSGLLTVSETVLPISIGNEYKINETAEVLSQVAVFSPIDVQGQRLTVEMHRLAETGEVHVLVRGTS